MTKQPEPEPGVLHCPDCGSDFVDGSYGQRRLGIGGPLWRTWLHRGLLRLPSPIGTLRGNVWRRSDLDPALDAARADGLTGPQKPGPKPAN